MTMTPEDRPASRVEVAPELIDGLIASAGEEVELLGPDGLLADVTKKVLERALQAELTGHLGYERHDPSGRGSGNSRNGTYPKMVLTEIGAVDLDVPRDRAGSFAPLLVPKGQTRLAGFNERIMALYARSMTVRDIQAHLREMYQVEVSLNYQLRKVTKNRGHFPNDDALLKLLYLALRNIGNNRQIGSSGSPTWSWTAALTTSRPTSPAGSGWPDATTRHAHLHSPADRLRTGRRRSSLGRSPGTANPALQQLHGPA